MKSRQGLSAPQILIIIAFPLLAAIVSLCCGRIYISPAEIILSLTQSADAAQASTVLWGIRLPRILLALLVGAGLSAAGCSFQSLFANPLATPDTVGAASGASPGAAVGILMGLNLIGIQLAALITGLIAVGLTWLAGSGRSRGINSVVLAGIMIGSVFNALISLVKFTADSESQLPSIVYWLMGSFGSAGYKSLLLGAPLIISGIAVLWLLRWKLNLLTLSDDEAKSLGVNLRLLRAAVTICAAAITASCVSMCGQVGWIGLLVPHMCRMKLGSNHLKLFPASVCIGAGFMVIVDTLARSVSAAEIPVSILTAVIGAPFFIILMRRTEGWKL